MARKNADTNSVKRSARAVALMLTLIATSLRRNAGELQHTGDDHHRRQRHRQEHLPAEPHQLIVAVARHDRLCHRDHEEHEKHFQREPDHPGIQVNGGSATGGSQPPRNRIVASAHIVVIATYSPSMNSRYGVEPYSVMKPATSSDSASTRSNGGRLVSASAET